MSFATGLAAARLVNRRMLRAAPTGLPRTRSTTTAILRGDIRKFLRWAVDSMSDHLAPPGPGPEAGLATFISAEWPEKVRVGENSPSLWPTMFSVAETGMKLRPLCTAKVCPTNSGRMVDRRDQVFTTFFWFPLMRSSIFLRRWASTKGPFLIERATDRLSYWLRTPLRRPLTMNLSVRLFLRVLRPLVFWPQGETGWGLPWPDLPSPPPCGWSTGFMARPRTVGRTPSQRVRPALPTRMISFSMLPTWPTVARQTMSTFRTAPEGRRIWAYSPSFAINWPQEPADRIIWAPWPGL